MPTCRRCGSGSPIPPHASSRSSGQEESGRPVWRWSSHARSRRGRNPRGVRTVGRHSGSCVRRVGDRRGARTVGRHRARLAEARARRVRGSPHVAGARQFRAGAGRGAAGRGSPDIGRHRSDCWSPAAPRSACGESGSTPSDLSRWRRTRTRCRPPIWRALPRCDSSWSGFGTCNLTFASRPRTARP